MLRTLAEIEIESNRNGSLRELIRIQWLEASKIITFSKFQIDGQMFT